MLSHLLLAGFGVFLGYFLFQYFDEHIVAQAIFEQKWHHVASLVALFVIRHSLFIGDYSLTVIHYS